MALFSCPECGRGVSTRADTCPGCGCPLDSISPPLEQEAGAPAPVTLAGTSASDARTPRELDLETDGDELRLHIHAPGGSQPKMWVRLDELRQAFEQQPAGRVEVEGRTARKAAAVVFVWDESDEVEVQAGWWVWVNRGELRDTLGGFGIRAPW